MMRIIDDSAFRKALLKFNWNIYAFYEIPCMVMSGIKMMYGGI